MNQSHTVKALDGLRGLAVMLVVLSHFSLSGMNLLPFLDFSGTGKSGVYLFFVLSAFLLTLQALQQSKLEVTHWHYWGGYLIRRICRIYPLYIIVLISAFAITNYSQGYGPKIESVTELGQHLVLLAGNDIYWAIPVEFKYYFLLPIVTLLLYFANELHKSVPAVVLVVAITMAFYQWPPSEMVANTTELGPYLVIFLLGSFSGFVAQSSVINILHRHRNWIVAFALISILVSLLMIPSVWRALVDDSIRNNHFHRAFLLYGILWSGCVIAAYLGKQIFSVFFEHFIWRFLGRVSFSIYLWHLPICHFISRKLDLHQSLEFVIAMVVTLGFAYLSYRFIERPFIAWGHNATQASRTAA